MMNIHARQVAWIVGASSGIGRSTAGVLARCGWDVVASGRRAAELESLKEDVDRVGGRLLVVPGDVSDPLDVERLVDSVTAWRGRLDAVVHCAGTNVANRRWSDLSVADFDRIADTNYKSVAYVAISALPYLRKAGGVMVVTSSWAGWRYLNRVGPSYGSSKAALGALVEAINHEEGANGVRATLLEPGEVSTDLIRSFQMPRDETELDHMIQPEAMADVIRYIVTLPRNVCVNEIVVSPTRNRLYQDLP